MKGAEDCVLSHLSTGSAVACVPVLTAIIVCARPELPIKILMTMGQAFNLAIAETTARKKSRRKPKPAKKKVAPPPAAAPIAEVRGRAPGVRGRREETMAEGRRDDGGRRG